MTLREEIDSQKRNNVELSAEVLDKLKNKNYSSGRPLQVGDVVLFGLIREYDGEDVNVKEITFNEDEIGVLYEEDTEIYSKEKTDRLPGFKKI